jgi:hypothetical protein
MKKSSALIKNLRAVLLGTLGIIALCSHFTTNAAAAEDRKSVV